MLPLIRRELPGATFRVVGRHDGALADLAVTNGVEVVGEVDDLDEVFDSTTAVVVPLRAGSGTRVKVLEAFARRLPVVSTSLGCEGLGVRDGVELLVGDTPEQFAAACVSLVRDPSLAASLADDGYRLWERSYQWGAVRPLVMQTAREAAAR